MANVVPEAQNWAFFGSFIRFPGEPEGTQARSETKSKHCSANIVGEGGASNKKIHRFEPNQLPIKNLYICLLYYGRNGRNDREFPGSASNGA